MDSLKTPVESSTVFMNTAEALIKNIQLRQQLVKQACQKTLTYYIASSVTQLVNFGSDDS